MIGASLVCTRTNVRRSLPLQSVLLRLRRAQGAVGPLMSLLRHFDVPRAGDFGFILRFDVVALSVGVPWTMLAVGGPGQLWLWAYPDSGLNANY